MNSHRKKKIAPVVVTLLFLIYFGFYFTMIIRTVPPVWRVLLAVIPLAAAIVMVCVCVQRFKEIDGGEEDDLSKY